MGTLFQFENSYAKELDGTYVSWQPTKVPLPRLLRLNHKVAYQLGLDADLLNSPSGVAILSGNAVSIGSMPLAQAYAGHQFGGFSPQLGDGRALLLGEVLDRHNQRRDIALKGSGPTPFSRGGDGKAAIGPVLREYVIGEAMHALGIPTTRALAAVGTGEAVYRERPLPGAVLTRVAASHLRVGTFEFFSARKELGRVRRLVEYAIRRHDPELMDRPMPYIEWLRAVVERQARLIAQWMHVGFIHGVMNTDNMTISGETIDYGPCAFMEAYNPHAVFSSIDRQGRYAYGNQPHIAHWNLTRLAESVLPLVAEDDPDHAVERVGDVIDVFPARYDAHRLAGVRGKLGFVTSEDGDLALAQDWLNLLDDQAVDHTLAWRRLADAAEGEGQDLTALFHAPPALREWLIRWRDRSSRESRRAQEQAEAMRRVNPLYIPRNHRVEEALAAATDRIDLEPFDRLLDVLTQPFDERPGLESYAVPAPAGVTACYKTFCGT